MTLNLRRFSRPEANFIACAVVLTLACFATIPAAHAGIVSFSGVTPLPFPPPPGLHPGDQPPVPTPIIFSEQPGFGVALPGGIPVDHNGSVVVAAPVVSGNVVSPL